MDGDDISIGHFYIREKTLVTTKKLHLNQVFLNDHNCPLIGRDPDLTLESKRFRIIMMGDKSLGLAPRRVNTMGIKVNDKSRSLAAQRQLTLNQLLNRNFQRLSSGLRINSAADDAAGLAISNRFTSQFRGINQAIRNAGDGISLAQTADAALGSVTDNLQRIRELSIQASNGILTSADRKSIQSEIDQLTDEIDRIGGTTTFNGRNILDGSGGSVRLQVGASSDETVDVPSGDARADSLGTAPQVTSSAIDSAGIKHRS